MLGLKLRRLGLAGKLSTYFADRSNNSKNRDGGFFDGCLLTIGVHTGFNPSLNGERNRPTTPASPVRMLIFTISPLLKSYPHSSFL
jgi:hypothetical protein